MRRLLPIGEALRKSIETGEGNALEDVVNSLLEFSVDLSAECVMAWFKRNIDLVITDVPTPATPYVGPHSHTIEQRWH